MSDHRSIPTHAEIARLTNRVRDGRLDDEQREQLAQLLDTIGSAVRVAPTVAARYPGQPERAAVAGLGCWAGVPGAYAALLEAGSSESTMVRPNPGRGGCHGRPRGRADHDDTYRGHRGGPGHVPRRAVDSELRTRAQPEREVGPGKARCEPGG